MAENDIQPIDLVVVNLYPFEATVAKPGCTLEEAIENIDIGGPSMIRSAAKNHHDVGVLTDPATVEDEARLRELCRFANAVGALATTERGAIPALPDRKRVWDFLHR